MCIGLLSEMGALGAREVVQPGFTITVIPAGWVLPAIEGTAQAGLGLASSPSGCSAVGSARALGAWGQGFKSPHPDQARWSGHHTRPV